MKSIDTDNITIDKLSLPVLLEKKVEADVLRLDKIHPLISGNKWFKLRYYLEEAKQLNKKTIVTFGGAWSNHILATAAACRLNGFNCTGIIRGEEPATLSPTLVKAKELGMYLCFISREDYKKNKVPEELDKEDYYLIAEGGYGRKGVEGAATLLDYCEAERYSHICCAAGTGTMTAGLINNPSRRATVVAFSVLKNNTGLTGDIKRLLKKEKTDFELFVEYHFGGYAKHNPALLTFMNEFYSSTSIPTDFVYTGKLFYGIHDLITNDFFPSGSKLLIIHSGGLQGNDSLSKGTLIF